MTKNMQNITLSKEKLLSDFQKWYDKKKKKINDVKMSILKHYILWIISLCNYNLEE